ncbi:insulinase family protein [Halomonas sp. M20]|uniref:insulinase family protein n=1 Tax=Halomonas sp. M20 TaxID=2763264 RepID=UPI001D0ADCB9|nr:insulinase family protein [Halomonas sp. M20]
MKDQMPRLLPSGSRMAEHQLTSGTRILAIEVPSARQVRLVCAIGAGYLDEPEDLPGLAHLLEHALFLGSSCHPEPGDFAAWVGDQGGRYNAHTDEYSTDVHLTLPPRTAQAGLERMLDITLHPSLRETLIAREVEVIEAEFQARMADPELHRQRALSQLFQASHPAFDCHHGNRQSLEADISALRSALHDFHTCHYRAERLSLVMLGPQPLEQQLELLTAAADRFREDGSPPLFAREQRSASTRWAQPGWIQWCPPENQPLVQPALELFWPLPAPITAEQQRIGEQLVSALNDGSLAATLQAKHPLWDLKARLTACVTSATLSLSLTLDSETDLNDNKTLIATCQARVKQLASQLAEASTAAIPDAPPHDLDEWPKTLARGLALKARTRMAHSESETLEDAADELTRWLAPDNCRVLEAVPTFESPWNTVSDTGTRFRRRTLVAGARVLASRSSPLLVAHEVQRDTPSVTPKLIVDDETLGLWWGGGPVGKEAFWCVGWPTTEHDVQAHLRRWHRNTLALRQAASSQGVVLELGGDTRGDWLMATGDAERLESCLVQALGAWPHQTNLSPSLLTCRGLLAQRLLNLLESLPASCEMNDSKVRAWAGGTLGAAEAKAGCRRLITELKNLPLSWQSVPPCEYSYLTATASHRGWPVRQLPIQSSDQAVMLQIDGPDNSPTSRALMQLLAQCHDVAFQQTLRQHQRLGYVAAVRYRETSDGWPRLGYVVQSPHAFVEALREAVNAFLRAQGVALAHLDSTTFDKQRTALKTKWGAPETRNSALVRAWKGLRKDRDWEPWGAEQQALASLESETLAQFGRDLVGGRLAGQWWDHSARASTP